MRDDQQSLVIVLGAVEKYGYKGACKRDARTSPRGRDLIMLGVAAKIIRGSTEAGIISTVVPGVSPNGWPAFVEHKGPQIELVWAGILVLTCAHACPCVVWRPHPQRRRHQVGP